MLPITRATLHSFCRTCLREFERPSKKLETSYNIETTENLSKWLTSTCSAVQLVANDAYPRCLCQVCFSKVRTFFEFRDKSLCSVEALRELLAEGMEETARKNLQLFCRTCLKKLKSTKRLANVAETTNVANWMLDCTGLEMNTNETKEYPRYLCSWCFKKLRNFVEFRDIAKQSCEYLESVVGRESYTDYDKKSGLKRDVNHESFMHNKSFQSVNNKASLIESEQYAVEIKAEPIRDNTSSNLQAQEVIFADKLPVFNENLSASDEDSECEQKEHSTLDNNDEDRNATIACTRKRKTTFFEVTEDSADDTTQMDQIDLNCDESDSPTSDSQQNSKKCTTEKSVHLPRKRIKCNQCERTFIKQFIYEAHIQAEHKGLEKPYQCNICNHSFRIFNNLRRHMTEKHTIYSLELSTTSNITVGKFSDPKFECKLCSRVFKRKDHLKDHHKTVHLNIRPFKCSFCEKVFATRKTCSVHEMGHTGERPFGCEKCDKTYRQKSELKIHLEMHTEKKELLCTICRRIKGSPEELKAHMEEHIASQQHQCPKCGRIFKKISHLNEHDRAVHLKLRPFKCSYCNKSFALAKTCRTHERTHTGERPEACTLCDQKFKQKSVLSNHMKRYHSQENGICH